MKRIALVICMAILLLVSCENQSNLGNEKELPLDEVDIEVDVFETLKLESAKFHFVVGWLSDTQIVFVEKEESVYNLSTFNVNTGEIDTLYTEPMIIVDAIIHPTKELILVHTSTNSTSANVKILSLDGVVLDEISIASSELAIEWNDLNPNLILLTAFHQDWTYDVLVYNGEEKEINTIPLEDPFPKWLGPQIVTVQIPEHALDGGTLHLYDLATETVDPLPYADIVHFDTYGNSMLIVEIMNGEAEYQIIDQGTILNNWTFPAVSNYSEWIFPDLTWIDNETIITLATTDGGELDNLKEPFMLVKIDAGEQVVISNKSKLTSIKCSPDGEKCLTGNSSEKLIDIKKKEEFNWLQLKP